MGSPVESNSGSSKTGKMNRGHPNLKRFAVNKIKNRGRGMPFNRMNLVGSSISKLCYVRKSPLMEIRFRLTFDNPARKRDFS